MSPQRRIDPGRLPGMQRAAQAQRRATPVAGEPIVARFVNHDGDDITILPATVAGWCLTKCPLEVSGESAREVRIVHAEIFYGNAGASWKNVHVRDEEQISGVIFGGVMVRDGRVDIGGMDMKEAAPIVFRPDPRLVRPQ